jgi:AcrR family transcriptional regulator
MSNAAAVHYHFGGRDGLLGAVLARHLGPLAAPAATCSRPPSPTTPAPRR